MNEQRRSGAHEGAKWVRRDEGTKEALYAQGEQGRYGTQVLVMIMLR